MNKICVLNNDIKGLGMCETNLVSVTPAAIELIKQLREAHGDIMFHQSGCCCEGCAPCCYVQGEFKISDDDILHGTVEACPFYITKELHKEWGNSHLTIDVVEGTGDSFSLESPRGVRFITTSNHAELKKQSGAA